MNKIMIISIIGILLFCGVDVGAINTMKASDDNHEPTAPIIEGPTHIRAGIEYNWSFYSTDPDGDNITYYVDWGVGCGGVEWDGPYTSGEKVEIPHTYTVKNTLTISSLAEDEKGAESNWTYFEVTTSKSSSINFISMRLSERFPNAFHILRRILIL